MQNENYNANEWTIDSGERTLILVKKRLSRVGFALLLVFFRNNGRFPRIEEIDEAAVKFVGQQLNIPTLEHTENSLFSETRTNKRFRVEIREHFGYKKASVADMQALIPWLQDIASRESTRDTSYFTAELISKCRELKLEPPTIDRMERIVKSAVAAHEATFFATVYEQLSHDVREKLDLLLSPPEKSEDTPRASSPSAPATLLRLRASPGRPGLISVQEEVAKLKLIRDIRVPKDIFENISSRNIDKYQRRVAVEAPYELRRHSAPMRLSMLAIYVFRREGSLVDGLVDLLIETIHRISAHAERKVERELLDDLKRVSGKQNILFELANAALEHPDDIVRDVLFPVAGEQTLQDLVKEWKASGSVYRITLRTVIRNSYRGYYRRMVPELLNVLEFRSNNERHQPIIKALQLIKRYTSSKLHSFPKDEDIPLNGVLKGIWRDAVIEKDTSEDEVVNRITYEIAVLEALREQLRCKEIWLIGANKYRNPDEDLPSDFEQKRQEYYQALNLTMDVKAFIDEIQGNMHVALEMLNAGIGKNPSVQILKKKNGWIRLAPLTAQPSPPNLAVLKSELNNIWPMTSLLDMIKEVDLRLNFSDVFKSPTAYETMERATLRTRLLLALHGIGTNAGLMRMANTGSGVSAKDLIYIRQRFLNSESLRQAIGIVANGTLQARNPDIWGDSSVSCASDSKHFGAWDQNLTTQWHVRYGGRGIMIYWHVERNSLCIHSQLRSPSSSEVASMIEGVLHHCTEMEVDRQYVDTHGQSTVAFAFCRLLGFELLPRLKNIYAQKLYRPKTGQPDNHENLQLILTRPINWELIHQQYDQMVKFATALRLGTAQTETILRRFTRKNNQHPTYKAFVELGHACKTIFICNYLHSEALRREINEGLNVIEQWNGATDFVFFARRGELTSNRHEDHEISMLSLHLVQNCMVYINTLMIQKVLSMPHWENRFTQRDFAALTPLIWEHINPYGRFELDMDSRIELI